MPGKYKAGQRRDSSSAAAGWKYWWETLETALAPVSKRMIELAQLHARQRVLDVATGIGEPALTAARVVGPAGHVTATDIAPGMLEIARERAEEAGLTNVEFVEADAETIDFPEGSFDAVLCRFGRMFLPNVAEMRGLVGASRPITTLGEGGGDPSLMERKPKTRSEHKVHRECVDSPLNHDRDADPARRHQQPALLHVAGIDHFDDEDDPDVVNNGQCKKDSSVPDGPCSPPPR